MKIYLSMAVVLAICLVVMFVEWGRYVSAMAIIRPRLEPVKIDWENPKPEQFGKLNAQERAEVNNTLQFLTTSRSSCKKWTDDILKEQAEYRQRIDELLGAEAVWEAPLSPSQSSPEAAR